MAVEVAQSAGWWLSIERVPWRWRHWRRLLPKVVYVRHQGGAESMWVCLPTWNIDAVREPEVDG